MTSTSSAPLRVLDLTDELAFQGARLLVGLGADVLRTDPGGALDPGARVHWHAGKRWVRLPNGLEGESGLDKLAAAADVVLESGPVAALQGVRKGGTSRWPHAVHVVVTPFGLTGPHREWLADDLVLASAGGMTWLGGRADGPPKPPPREQAVQVAGAHAAIAAQLGILARDRTGEGQLIDVSAQEAVAATLETSAIAWIHTGRYPVRNGGVYEHVAHRIFAALDGFMAGGYSGSNRMWTDLLAWMVEEGEATDLIDERWSDPVLRWQGRPHVDEVVARFVAKRCARAVADEGRARALPWAEVVPPARLMENPQLRDRDFFITVTGLGLPGGTVEDAGFPWAAPDLPRPVRLPALNETPAAATWTHPKPRGRRARPGAPCGGRSLDGVRVLDLTWVLAGPYMTKQLAEHGAEIVKVESSHRQDPTRFAPSMRLREGAGPNDSGYFLNFNRGKRSVALNLRTDEGKQLLRDLVPHCDVVVENFSPGVLARWGMDYESLRPQGVIGSIAGGWERMLAVTPAVCRLRLDLRISPRSTPLQVKRELAAFVAAVGRELDVDLGVDLVLAIPATHTPSDAPIVRRAIEAWERANGRAHEPVADNSGATDSNILRARGVPTARVGMPKATSHQLDVDPALDFSRGMNTVDVRAMRRLCEVLARTTIATTGGGRLVAPTID